MFRAKLHLHGNTLKGPNLFFFFFRSVQYNRGDHYTNKISRFLVYYATSPGADAYRRDTTKPRTSCSSRESALGGFELIPSSSCVARNKRSDVPNYWRCSFHLHFVYERTFARVLKINIVTFFRDSLIRVNNLFDSARSSLHFNKKLFQRIWINNSARKRFRYAKLFDEPFKREIGKEI